MFNLGWFSTGRDEAAQELRTATRAAPREHTTFLALGVFLRKTGDFTGARKALTRSAELMGQMNPDFRVIRELGFTDLALGRKEDALKSLGSVLEHLASKGEHDQFDPETAVAAAKICEDKGDLKRAADLYRHLAVGYDVKNHFTYNLEAARLLKAGGDGALAAKYLTRAEELAKTGAEVESVGRMLESLKA